MKARISILLAGAAMVAAGVTATVLFFTGRPAEAPVVAERVELPPVPGKTYPARQWIRDLSQAEEPAAAIEKFPKVVTGFAQLPDTQDAPARDVLRPAPSPTTAQPAYPSLADRALQIEYEAGWRTELLEDRIPLTEQQAAAIYPIYARASRSYQPGMTIEGEPASAAAQPVEQPTAQQVDEQIYEVLEPDQQAVLEQEWIDRDLWWTEIVAQLAEDFPLDGEAAAATTEASEPESVEEPEAHQGGNLFDLLGQ